SIICEVAKFAELRRNTQKMTKKKWRSANFTDLRSSAPQKISRCNTTSKDGQFPLHLIPFIPDEPIYKGGLTYSKLSTSGNFLGCRTAEICEISRSPLFFCHFLCISAKFCKLCNFADN